MWPKRRQNNRSKPIQPQRITDMYVPNNLPSPLGQKSSQPKRQVLPTRKSSTTVKQGSDIQAPSAKFWLVFLLIVIVFGGSGTGAAYYFLKYKPAHKTQTVTKAAVDNTNHVTDDPLGLKFAISKDFAAVDKTELIKQNPNFVYGFKQADVPNVACTVSQQKRTSGGAVAPTALRDGTLKGIQKTFPDAKLDDYQDILLNNGQDAASMVVSYTDTKVAIKEKMVVAATDPRVTYAFCTSPTPLFDFYNAKFQPFFDSLEVY